MTAPDPPRAADDLDRPPAGDRPRLPAAQEPCEPAVAATSPSGGRTFSTPRPRRALHRGARFWTSIRSGWSAARSAGSSGVEQYVNDRPYAASSFLSVAIARMLGTALGGRSKERPELAASAIPLEARLSGAARAAARSWSAAVRAARLRARARPAPARPGVPGVGREPLRDAHPAGRGAPPDLLSHLYVLVPVLDNRKHYWVEQDEIDKLLRHGEGWLAAHPARELIVTRYLRYQRSLTRLALEQLVLEEGEERGGRRPPRSAPRRRSGCTSSGSWPSPRRSGHPAPNGCSTSAAARAGCCACCSPSASSARSSASTCRPGRSRSPPAGCTSTRCRPPARAHPPPARLAGLPRPAAEDGYDAAAVVEVDRAPRPAAARGLRAHPVRPRAAGDGRHDHAERRVQQPLRDPRRRAVAPRRPPLRVDPRRVRGLGRRRLPSGTATRWPIGGVGGDDPEVGPPTQMAVFSR